MNRFIALQSSIANLTLSEFAHNLKMALETEMFPEELDEGTLIQIAGYSRRMVQAIQNSGL